MQVLFYDYIETPIGSLMLAGDGANLVELGFPAGKGARRHHPGWVFKPEIFAAARGQLVEYFAGQRRVFTIPIAPQGTEFQLRVWGALVSIPYGETLSYGELARQIGKPSASRAVGAANGRNPIPIIIPCHRVIGASGRLVGFGGGLGVKQKLLALEQEAIAPTLFEQD
ncbi:MAG: methylated-DNA--[protein]-cysteine S-methyltransferase [Gammaproteobacteria bacterium]|jgi:methylated-DNA-[protein]-cysteine S-methyltransferase